MKKTFLFIVGVVLFAGTGCSNEKEEFTTGENLESLSLFSPPEFYQMLLGYTSGYDKKEVPQNVEQERLHKTVFSAALGMYLVPERFGAGDTYSPVYQSWRVGSGLYLTAVPAMASLLEAVDEHSPNSVASVAAFTGNVGQLYRTVLNNQYVGSESTFHSVRDSRKLMYAYLDVERLLGISIDDMYAEDDMDDISPVIDAALQYQDPTSDVESQKPYAGCFTMRDGLGYFYAAGTYNEYSIGTLEVCLPIVVALETDNQKNNFVSGLENRLRSREGIELSSGEISKIVSALYVAAYAADFWIDIFDAGERPYLTVYRSSVSAYNDGGKFLLTVSSNRSWHADVTSDFFTLTRSSGTNDGHTVVVVKENPGTLVNPRRGEINFYMFLENNVQVLAASVSVFQGPYAVSGYSFGTKYLRADGQYGMCYDIGLGYLGWVGTEPGEWYVDPKEVPGHISVLTMEGSGGGPFLVCVDPLPTFGGYRQADIRVRSKANGNILATLPVDQVWNW